jgi:hypothetical protein
MRATDAGFDAIPCLFKRGDGLAGLGDVLLVCHNPISLLGVMFV